MLFPASNPSRTGLQSATTFEQAVRDSLSCHSCGKIPHSQTHHSTAYTTIKVQIPKLYMSMKHGHLPRYSCPGQPALLWSAPLNTSNAQAASHQRPCIQHDCMQHCWQAASTTPEPCCQQPGGTAVCKNTRSPNFGGHACMHKSCARSA